MKRECYGVNWGLWNVQIHQHLKAKQSKNRRKSKRHGKGKPHSRGKHGPPRPWAHHGLTVAATTGRGVHHGPWWPLWWLPGCFPPAPHFGLLGASPWAARFAFPWRILGLFLLSSFDPHGPNFFILDSSQTFLPKFRLES